MAIRIALSLAPAMSSAGAQQVRAGVRAPDIDFKTLEGTHVRLSGFRGHPVVMTFWGTWCPPCREEFPELVGLYKRQHAAGLEVLAVNLRDQELNDGAVRKFVTEFDVPFPVLLDPRGSSRRAYQLVGMPTTVFIDSAGIIQRVHTGPLTAAELRQNVAMIHAVP
ncbi:MAG TPA: TlpA disulfide reductase family protein [Gemmatimonadaceae bacterium]|nr:TlpA disulfide reductase family protein [Gemmatimonadaceae bacterium]